ncbi:hypothetical protein L9F63_020914, partial [Diploptera punctata]
VERMRYSSHIVRVIHIWIKKIDFRILSMKAQAVLWQVCHIIRSLNRFFFAEKTVRECDCWGSYRDVCTFFRNLFDTAEKSFASPRPARSGEYESFLAQSG